MPASANRRPPAPIKLYRYPLSGHCHRVELFLTLLDLPFTTIDIDLLKKEQRTPGFLKLNMFGQIPVIQDGDVTLADSNAILVYLTGRYAADPEQWLPSEPRAAAEVQRWFSAAAGPLDFGPATARVIQLFVQPRSPDEAIARAKALFAVMEQTLQASPFLAGPRPTLADIALYSYTAHAPEGMVSLDPYPYTRGWLARVEALPRFVPMARSAIGLAAA